MDPVSFDKWTKTRKIGIWLFVIIYGALGFGGSTFLVSCIFLGLLHFHNIRIPMSSMISFLVICLVGGVIFGIKMWGAMEESYTRDANLEPALKDRKNYGGRLSKMMILVIFGAVVGGLSGRYHYSILNHPISSTIIFIAIMVCYMFGGTIWRKIYNKRK